MLSISESSANHVQAPPVGDAHFSHRVNTPPSPVMEKLSTVANSPECCSKPLSSSICLSTPEKRELEREQAVLMMLEEPQNHRLLYLGEHYQSMLNNALASARNDDVGRGAQEHIDICLSAVLKTLPADDEIHEKIKKRAG